MHEVGECLRRLRDARDDARSQLALAQRHVDALARSLAVTGEACDSARARADALEEVRVSLVANVEDYRERCEAIARERDEARAQVQAWQAEELARRTVERLRRERDEADVESAQRALSLVAIERDEALAEVERLRAEVERLRHERRMFRRRLAECIPWVGVVPYPNTKGSNEMVAVRDLAIDTLEDVSE